MRMLRFRRVFSLVIVDLGLSSVYVFILCFLFF